MLFTCSRACYMIHVPKRKFIQIFLSSSVSFPLHAILILLLNWKGTGKCKCARLCVFAIAVSVRRFWRFGGSERARLICIFSVFVLLPLGIALIFQLACGTSSSLAGDDKLIKFKATHVRVCARVYKMYKVFRQIISHNNHVMCAWYAIVCFECFTPRCMDGKAIKNMLFLFSAIINKIAYNHVNSRTQPKSQTFSQFCAHQKYYLLHIKMRAINAHKSRCVSQRFAPSHFAFVSGAFFFLFILLSLRLVFTRASHYAVYEMRLPLHVYELLK